jgi:hypothetical protein
MLTRLQQACKIYLNGDFVFKRCSETIIVLQKPKENFQSNEKREDIKDKNYAKFRCNGLLTIDIIHCETLYHNKEYLHNRGPKPIHYIVITIIINQMVYVCYFMIMDQKKPHGIIKTETNTES